MASHSDNEEEDLKIALALSMQQSPSRITGRPAANNEAVDLTSETEEENNDMRRAIAMSLRDSRQSISPRLPEMQRRSLAASPVQGASHEVTNTSTTHIAAVSAEPSRSSGLLGIDRKAMEEERLARLSKRKRDPSPDQPKKQIMSTAPCPEKQSTTSESKSTQVRTLEYPRGAIKRTFATKFPRTDDITIDEVLQAESVNIAVISSFMWDSEWLNKKLNPLQVKQIWIMNAKCQDVQQRWVREMKDAGVPNLKIHFPPMEGLIHSMHSKFMLLFGNDKLRVVVPTANMTPIDWGDKVNNWQPGVMENSVFLVDLPRRIDGMIGTKEDLTVFGQELVYFLEKQEIDKKVIEGVLKFDFTQTEHLAFVHAIGGVHKGELQHPTGLSGLAKAIRDLQLDNVKDVELDYASASLGAINDNFLQRIYLAAHGKALATTTAVARVREHFRVYFPTDNAVQNSIGGPDCGGIISLSRRYYEAATFPRECLRNYDSTRRGMLSHNKLLFVRGIKNSGRPFAWVYVGSANMSESAWGAQKVLKSGQMGSLNMRNWECGVVVPVAEEKMAAMKLSDGEVPPMSVFGGTIEVPFVCADELYGQYGDKQPWYRVG